MSASDEWTEWHLTPRGWEAGTKLRDHGFIANDPRPADAVLTERYEEEMPYWGGRWIRDVSRVWGCEDAERIQALLQEHGPCPRKL